MRRQQPSKGKNHKRKPAPRKRPIHRRARSRRRVPAPAVRTKPNPPVWSGIARAIETEPRDEKTIKGASGLEHQVLQVSVDERRDRLLVISAESDPRVAALVQQDIQATFSLTKVLVARPSIVDLGVIARNLVQLLGRSNFRLKEINEHLELLNALPVRSRNAKMSALFDEIAPLAGAFQNAPLPVLNQVLTFVQQLANFDFAGTFKSTGKNKGSADPLIKLDTLISIDTIAADIQAGVCPLPMYDFNEHDFEVLRSDSDVDAMAELLQTKNIYQYFFPPPDQTALALIDRGLREPDSVVDAVNRLPSLGHPLGLPDIVDITTKVEEVVHALAKGGQVAEGELNLTLTQPGVELRANVKMRPKESVFSKLLKVLKLPDPHFHYHG